MKRDSTGMERAATNLSAEAGGSVFTEGYKDRFFLLGAVGVILDQGIFCWWIGCGR